MIHMSFKEIKDRLMSHFGNSKPSDMTRRPDGGTSCYRPFQKRTTATEENGAAYDQIPCVHTGFTGMNPPAEDTTFSSSAGQASSGTPYNAYGGYGAPLTKDTAPQYSSAMSGYQDNISYMPGTSALSGTYPDTAIDTVNILTMTSLQSCYDAIASMKNGEVLILSMDAIANEGEIIRCQDMLAGAAFTLGCTVRQLAGSRMILITPGNIHILPAERERPKPIWQTPQTPVMPQRTESEQPRQRRTVQNNNLYENPDGSVNPYTGRRPVAAGDYTNYGGFGY